MDDLEAIQTVLGRELDLYFLDHTFISRVLCKSSVDSAAIHRAISRQVRFAADSPDPRPVDIATALAAAIVIEAPCNRGNAAAGLRVLEAAIDRLGLTLDASGPEIFGELQALESGGLTENASIDWVRDHA